MNDHDAAVLKDVVTLFETQVRHARKIVDLVRKVPEAPDQVGRQVARVDEIELPLVDEHGDAAKVVETARVIPVRVRDHDAHETMRVDAGERELIGNGRSLR